MKSYSKIDFTSRTKPNKRFVQSLLYRTSKVKSHSLILCGPDLISHIIDAKTITNDNQSLFIYEQDVKTYNNNIKDLNSVKEKIQINIINEDINNAFKAKKIYRFIDLDFCTTLNHNLATIINAYYYLKSLEGKSGTLNKHLLITFCLRKCTLDENIETLCKLFNIQNDFKLNKFITKHKVNQSQSSNACYISYKDEGPPMCTFSYQF